MSNTFAALALLSLSMVGGPSGATTDPTSELTAMEHRWVRAIVQKDATTLTAILADTYTDTDEEGHRSNKAETLAVRTSCDLVFQDITLSDLHVHAYGTAAVVTGTAAQHGAFKGEAVSPKVVFTDTFVRVGAHWMVAASQRTAVR